MRKVILLLIPLCLGASAVGADLMNSFTFLQNSRGERPTYHIPLLNQSAGVKVDGVLNETAWEKALLLDSFINESGDIGPTQVRLLTDGENLHMGFVCHERDMASLKATAGPDQRDQRIWANNCIDMKFATAAGEVQFVVNARGSIADMLGGDPAWNAEGLQVATTQGESSWTAEIMIPLTSLALRGSTEGQTMPIAIGRTDPKESQHTFTRPYGSVHHAPIFLLGDKAAATAVRSRQTIASGVQLRFIMDREEYPRVCETGIGRVRIWSGGGPPMDGLLSMVIAVMQGDHEVARHQTDGIAARLADFEMNLSTLPVGEYTVEARLMTGDKVAKRAARRLVIKDQPVSATGSIKLTIPAGPASLDAYGYTFGVPFPWGALASADNVRLLDDAGRELPMQAQVTGRWARNGHVRWLLIDAVAPMRTRPQSLTLEYGPGVSRQPLSNAITVDDQPDNVRVDVGAMQFDIPKRNTPGVARLVCDSEVIKPHEQAGPYMIDQNGVVYRGSLDPDAQVVVESAGPVKTQISVTGWHVSESGKKLGKYILRYAAYRGLPWLHVDHTFIITEDEDTAQYNDIGYAIGTYAGTGYFGAPRITPFRLNGKDDSAYLIQIDDLTGRMYQGGKFIDDFGRAEGWMNAGGVTISVRNFWQNFPKELEAQQDRAIIHLWPGHGEPARYTGAYLNERNAYRHMSALEGKLLNFQVPQEYHPLIERPEYANVAINEVSPVGVSKTHHMLIQCNSWNWEQSRARSVSRIFDSNPTVTVEPQWVCDSKVFGDMGVRDANAQPGLEQAIDGTMATIARSNDRDRDYGMWTFGDSHHFWNWGERRIVNVRTWRLTHHNWPRWSWLQYARSGDKTTFDYACRNGRNVVDVSHCHYTNDTFRASSYPRRKELGGLCDYKGHVKWSSGDRFDYNSVADSMFAQYYFTGDRRALDTALLHVAYMVEDDSAQQSREGSARITSLAAYVFHTWDMDALELLERHIDAYVDMQQPDGVIPPEPTTPFWTNGFIRYVDLTGADRGRSLVTRWADLICNVDPATRIYPHQQIIDVEVCSMLSHLAQAYVYTGDEKYLRMAKIRADRFSDRTYQGEDPRFVGVTAFWEENMPQSWFLTDSPHYAFALQKHGGNVEPAAIPHEHKIASMMRERIDGQEHWMFHARLKQDRDEPFVIDFTVPQYDYVAELVPVDGKGKVMQVRAVNVADDDKFARVHIEVPRDGAVEYALRLRSAKSNAHIGLPLTQSGGMREVYPMQVAGQGLTICGGEWFYFNLPSALTSMRLRATARNIGNLTVRNGQAHAVLDELWVGNNGAATFDVPVESDRHGWSLRFRGDKTMGRALVNNDSKQPLYLAVSPDRWFEPSVAEWDWNSTSGKGTN